MAMEDGSFHFGRPPARREHKANTGPIVKCDLIKVADRRRNCHESIATGTSPSPRTPCEIRSGPPPGHRVLFAGMEQIREPIKTRAARERARPSRPTVLVDKSERQNAKRKVRSEWKSAHSQTSRCVCSRAGLCTWTLPCLEA